MKNSFLTTLILTLLAINSYSQYDYGIKIVDKDLLTQGKLNLYFGTHTVIGNNSGFNLDTVNMFENCFLGYESGANLEEGSFNTLIGGYAGNKLENGTINVALGRLSLGNSFNAHGNVAIGQAALYANSGNNNLNYNVGIGESAGEDMLGGSYNIFLGYQAGFASTGSRNIFIGANTGMDSIGNGLLAIGSPTSNLQGQAPLIYGEFDNKLVKVNGSLHIAEFARLIPSSVPSSLERGTVYYDSSDNNIKVWTGSAWETLLFGTSAFTDNSLMQSVDAPCNTACLELIEENQMLRVKLEQIEAKLERFALIESKIEELQNLTNLLIEKREINSEEVQIENTAQLEQNVPNPGNGSTKIRYYIPNSSQNAKINIFDFSGKLIKDIDIRYFGRGEVELHVDDFYTGIYHYYLEVDGKIIDGKKMFLIR